MNYPDEALVSNFASQGIGTKPTTNLLEKFDIGIVLVTMDYRLGIFGVLALGDENVVPANLAIHGII